MSTTIRQLTASDVESLRALRLEGLRLNAEAFGSTYEDEYLAPVDKYLGWLNNSTFLGAFHETRLVGMAAFGAFTGRKDAHKGWLRAMYVSPNFRRSGAGRQLVQAILEVARTRVEQIQLAVVSTNTPAIRLYESCGFIQYGLEPRALKYNNSYSDEILMWRDL
jgi:ribosomal protein S18 acetylase RimI-like enzyme